ncbi:MAG: hypothetical protein ACRYG8_51560 [Janthinobacterium lividum]
MSPVRWLGTIVIVGAALTAWVGSRPNPPDWRPIGWPFPRDAWPPGLAFACAPATCGTDVRLYVRPKRGFCANCETGVTSDAEVDGVADLDMIAVDFTPLTPGQPFAAGDMAGRQRAYTLLLPHGRRAPALGMAMTRRKQCDLVVAVAEGAVTDQAKRAIDSLLTSDRVAPWIARELDGR